MATASTVDRAAHAFWRVMMTGRIMKSIFAAALIAVVLTAAMILWALYGNMESTTV